MENKQSRTIDEQIALLKNRGLNIKDEQKAAFYLNHISYYRLKGYWWDMQQDRINHKFQINMCFEEVIARYLFDKELRLILFDAIETIEIALRTKMIYHLSQPTNGLWYLNQEIFEDKALHNSHIEDLQREFARSGEIFAKEYKKKHPITNSNPKIWESEAKPDAWIIFEVATFGTLSKMYKNIKHQLPQKATIAKEMGLNLHSELSSWLEAISYLRNIIAHHSRVWSRNMVKRPTPPRNPRYQWLQYPMLDVQMKKPFYVITSMLYLCNAIDPNNTVKCRLHNLFQQYPNIGIYKIGFFKDWQNEPIWKLTTE